MTTPIKYRISSTATKPMSDSVKGAPLTSLEIDGNFRSIKDSIELIQSGYLPAGYTAPVEYAAGIILSSASQTVSYQGEVYAPKAAEVPFTASGTFEVTKFVQIQSVASVDLAASSGSSLVGYDGGTVQDVLDGAKSLQDYTALRAYTGRAKRVYITGLLVTAKPAGIAGSFQYDSTDTASVDNGGTIIVGADGRRWKRQFSGAVNIQWFGAKGDWDGATGTNNTAAIDAAVGSYNVVYAPEGSYLYSGMSINKNNVVIYGDGDTRTSFVMDTTAAPAVSIGSMANVSGVEIRSMRFEGNANNLGAISLGTTSFYAARVKLRDLFITGFSNTGASAGYAIRLNSNQNTDIHNVWTSECHYGLYRANGGFSTSTRISGKGTYFGRNQTHGIYIDGQCDDLDISDAVVEGCLGAGVYVTSNAVTLSGVGRGTRILMDSVYFEENNKNGLSAANAIVVVGNATGYAQHTVDIVKCQFASNLSAPPGSKSVSLDRVYAYFGRSRITPNDIVTTSNCSVRFELNRYPSGADYVAAYKALLGDISVSDFTQPASGSSLSQINMVNALTFPVTQRNVSDPNTLDDYEEGTWVPVLSSDATPPTVSSYVDRVGTYTKIGNLVFVRCQIRATISDIGTGTPRVAGLPFVPEGLEGISIGLSSILTTTAGPNYLVSTPGALFNGAAYKTTAGAFLTFTSVYRTSA